MKSNKLKVNNVIICINNKIIMKTEETENEYALNDMFTYKMSKNNVICFKIVEKHFTPINNKNKNTCYFEYTLKGYKDMNEVPSTFYKQEGIILIKNHNYNNK